MKVIRLTSRDGYDGLTLHEEPKPVPGRHDVLIDVKAAALNYRDVVIAKGQYPGPVSESGPDYSAIDQ
jgi:NADPH:quinone reductase-like Zn-dependent oxidoreductase